MYLNCCTVAVMLKITYQLCCISSDAVPSVYACIAFVSCAFLIFFLRVRQVELHQHIETLLIDLQRISEAQPAPLDFEEYVKKLTNTKRRVMVINNILHNAQVRISTSAKVCWRYQENKYHDAKKWLARYVNSLIQKIYGMLKYVQLLKSIYLCFCYHSFGIFFFF